MMFFIPWVVFLVAVIVAVPVASWLDGRKMQAAMGDMEETYEGEETFGETEEDVEVELGEEGSEEVMGEAEVEAGSEPAEGTPEFQEFEDFGEENPFG